MYNFLVDLWNLVKFFIKDEIGQIILFLAGIFLTSVVFFIFAITIIFKMIIRNLT